MKLMKLMKLKANEGITIYLALLVMSGTLAVALSVSTIFIGEFKISSDTVNSLKAVYVADSAMEYTLYQTRPLGSYDSVNHTLNTSFGVIALSDTASTLMLSDANCLGLGSMCDAKAKLVAAGDPSVPACSITIGATNCTQIIASGVYKGVNRKIEIVYPNL